MKRERRSAGLLALLLCAALLGGSAPAAAAPEGSTVWGYSEGMALCQLDGKWGYVNAQRNVVIPIQFESAVSFTLGLAAVKTGGKLGVIRQDGTYLIPAEYDSLMPLECGLYIAQKGGRWGVVSVERLPDGQGGTTNVLYDLVYDSVEVVDQGGIKILVLTRRSDKTMIPIFDLPGILLQRRAPSARFPLNRGKLPGFSDVTPKDWYALWVNLAYNVGLASGVGNNRFGPGQTLTVAETLKLAAYLESRYKDDDFHLQTVPAGTVWYRPAVDYCLAGGIIKPGEFGEVDYSRPVTRTEVARIFSNTALAREMPVINSLDRVKSAVPDIGAATPSADAIYGMYAKGILTGVDGKMTFNPGATITRAEVAAIVSRMARAEQRLTLWS